MRKVSGWLVFLVVGLAVLLFGGGAAVVVTIMRTKRQQFLDLITDEVVRQLSELRPDLGPDEATTAGRIVASQAAHETGYGATVAWKAGWNFSNLAAGFTPRPGYRAPSGWTGETVEGGDTEPDGKGGWRIIVQQFRKYPSLAVAVSDFFFALSWPPYRPARERLFAGDLAGFVQAMHDGGWFTAPAPAYLAAVQAAYDSGTAA